MYLGVLGFWGIEKEGAYPPFPKSPPPIPPKLTGGGIIFVYDIFGYRLGCPLAGGIL